MADLYAIEYTEQGKASRKSLPKDVTSALLEILDGLAENPEAFPNRIQKLNDAVRIYAHPSPPLQVMFQIDAARRVIQLLHFVAPQVSVTKPVFISYSHKDAQWLEKLKKFLDPLEKKNLIRIWDDTEIPTGAQWLAEIRNALGSARVAVFLVTQDFLNSSFIQSEELPPIIEAATRKDCLLFWIAVKSSTFNDSPFAKFQGAIPPHKPLAGMSEEEQDAMFVSIYEKLKEAVLVQ